MTVPREEAADALQAIQNAAAQSATAFGYRMASPHLLLWGVIWVGGYTASYLGVPPLPLWGALVTAGVIASFWIGSHGPAVPGHSGWRFGATLVAVLLFLTALFVILPPASPNQMAAIYPILVAIWYVLMGIWGKGSRMIWLGAAIGVLTVGGYVGWPAYFMLWMAVVGGGGLILGGLWLRSA